MLNHHQGKLQGGTFYADYSFLFRLILIPILILSSVQENLTVFNIESSGGAVNDTTEVDGFGSSLFKCFPGKVRQRTDFPYTTVNYKVQSVTL